MYIGLEKKIKLLFCSIINNSSRKGDVDRIFKFHLLPLLSALMETEIKISSNGRKPLLFLFFSFSLLESSKSM